ncbi:MAG: DUF2892 domain-containing protein [Chloroflexi bacterium]|nr:DUF2892 domain-containing protein [Chloroflexota bacterium]
MSGKQTASSIGAAGLAIAFLWASGVLQIVLWALGGILLLEGLTGFCPLTYLRRRAASKKGA